MRPFPKPLFNYFVAAISVAVMLLGACTNDLKKIREISAKEVNSPIDTTKEVNVIYSDSAKVKAQIKSPLMLQFNDPKNPYILMPKGVHIVFFDNTTKESGNIVADTGYQYINSKIIKLHKNVVVKNIQGDTFKSDELVWDMINHKIFSNKPVDVLMVNGNVGHGTSMETNEKFMPLSVKNQTGVIYVSPQAGQ